jgi:ATP-dependent Clp protease, protease subunit
MSSHVIHFNGPINLATTERIRRQCLTALKKKAEAIDLHFSSTGGATDHGFSLYHFLRSLPVPLTVHNMGNVDSIAVIIFLAGDKRYACPHSRFLLHALKWNFDAGSADHARMREFVSSLDNDLERYVDIFRERTGHGDTVVDVRGALTGQEKILTPVQALDAGIVHGVIEAKIDPAAVRRLASGMS